MWQVHIKSKKNLGSTKLNEVASSYSHANSSAGLFIIFIY